MTDHLSTVLKKMFSNQATLYSTQDDMFATRSDQSVRPKTVTSNNSSRNGLAVASSSIFNSKSASKSADSVLSFVETFGSPMSCHAVRIGPGEELRKALLDVCERKRMKAAFILTCVGSSRNAKIRLANATSGDTNYLLDLCEPHEIISLSGTLSDGGHLHVSLADQTGRVRGGHLIELIVNTTAEVVIGECTALVFQRHYDQRSGFKELVIQER